MSLAAGSRLGAYEVLSLLGTGGMGEVYRAKDHRLNRHVALKVLPPEVASNPERLARFEREAQVLAALNHPNIAAIYGVEDSGGTPALVMELVEGETLADRIARGPVPLDEALPLARQIAEALEAAHEQGIIHRDLKPANIKVREDGTLKVLDFGLAKAMEPSVPLGASGTLNNSPTITSPALMTGVGVLLGTAAYMSPEQAKGKPADKRSDIWAFGCVLYEMLTATQAFHADDLTETVVAILSKDPTWERLSATVPAEVRRLLRRCLTKEVRRRLRDIGEARIALESSNLRGHIETSGGHGIIRSGTLRWVSAAGAIVIAAVATGAYVWSTGREIAPSRVVQFSIAAPESSFVPYTDPYSSIAVSPDGERIAIVLSTRVGGRGVVNTLALRSVRQVALTPVPNTEGAASPFFSPDGRSLGFFASGELRIVPVAGGAVRTVVKFGSTGRGAFWTTDDIIYFCTGRSPADGTGALLAVPARGGAVRQVTKPARGEVHMYPAPLPGSGRALVTTSRGRISDTPRLVEPKIALVNLATGELSTIIDNAMAPRYAGSGWLLYQSADALMAMRFDPKTGTTTGDAIQVARPIASPFFDVAADGTLAAVAGSAESMPAGLRTLVWVDRAGAEQETGMQARPIATRRVRLSPDGTSAAMDAGGENNDVWIWNFGRGTLTRTTTAPAEDWMPVWTPDGKSLVFASGPPSNHSLAVGPIDGLGTLRHLGQSAFDQFPMAVTPDGQTVVYRQQRGASGTGDLWIARLDQSAPPKPLFETPFFERYASLSPDGKWLAYDSDQSGRYEVYVRPFPETTRGQWQISNDGGAGPVWARSGRELFYIAADGWMMSASIKAGDTLNPSLPVRLFNASSYYSPPSPGGVYDVSPDGRRFLMVKTAREEAPPNVPVVVVTSGWLGGFDAEHAVSR